MNQYLYIIIICVITLSCAQEPNDEKHIEDVDSTPIDSVEINRINLVKKGMIGEYSQDFNVFDDKCSKYYESLLKEINIWPENAKIIDFMEFTPSKVLNETSDNLSQGVFVYSFYETIEDSIDSNYFAQAGFFNNQRQVLIPVHLKDSGYVELDTIFEI